MKQLKVSRAATRVALTAALSVAWAASAYADEASEQGLRQQVDELKKELSELKETVRGGYFTSNSDLEARVSELERVAGDTAFASNFKYGMKSQTADGAFQYQFYGWFQNDWSWQLDNNNDEDPDAGTEFSNARIGAQGQIYGNVKFKTEYDFSDDEDPIKDVWMELANCSFGNIRVGHFKEPIGLDILTDDRFTTFMSRNSVSSIMPNRNTGAMLHGMCMDDSILYQVGVFRDTGVHGESSFGSASTAYAFTGRVSGRAMVEDDGKNYLHWGVAGSWRDLDDPAPTAPYNPVGVFTTFFSSTPAEDCWIAAAEAAYVMGPLVTKGEFAHFDADVSGGGSDFEMDAWAAEIGYWLTGEQWEYSKSAGAFGRPNVKKNFGDEDGTGAWQVAARYDALDVNDNNGISGDAITVGVNWFVNPNTRVTLNYFHFDGDSGSTTNSLGLRFQIDF